MAHIIADLKEAFRRGNVFIQLIYINVGVFVATTLINIFLLLFNRSADGIFELLALPASFTRFIFQPWSLFTYMFMHAGFMHILFNMLWLYWFGQLFLYFFSGKHLRGLYILGGICGGLLYMISYNIFPYFYPMVETSTLVGASASVLAIVVATAYREPNYPVRLFLFGTIQYFINPGCNVCTFAKAGSKPKSGQCSAQVSDMSACIAGSDKQQVCEYHYQS